MGKHRFITESVMSMKLRALAVIRDSSLSIEDRCRIIGKIKNECSRSYGNESRQTRELQVFINKMLKDEQVMDEQIKEEEKTGGDPSGD